MHLGERLTEFIDGRLDPIAAEEVERHLKTCPMCRSELQALRAVRVLVRTAEAPEPRAAFWQRLETRLAGERVRLVRRGRLWRGVVTSAIGLAAAAAVALTPVGQVPTNVDAYLHEHARYRALHGLTDEAVVTLVSTDASLGLEPEVYGR